MEDLIFATLFFGIILFLLWRLVRAVIRRARLMSRLKKICEKRGYRLRRMRPWFASFFRIGARPDFIVSAEKEYCVRLITTVGKNRFYHFLNDQYAASHTKGGVPLPMAKHVEIVTFGEKFFLLPEMELPRDIDGRREVVPVLLFNPVPLQITAMDAEGNNCSLIGAGGRIGRFVAYGGAPFCEMLEGRGFIERKKNRWGE